MFLKAGFYAQSFLSVSNVKKLTSCSWEREKNCLTAIAQHGNVRELQKCTVRSAQWPVTSLLLLLSSTVCDLTCDQGCEGTETPSCGLCYSSQTCLFLATPGLKLPAVVSAPHQHKTSPAIPCAKGSVDTRTDTDPLVLQLHPPFW